MTEIQQEIKTLETEIKEFVNVQPYWAKYLCSEIIVGNTLTDENIETAFSYLLEKLKLLEETKKPKLSLSYNPDASSDFKETLTFNSLEKVEGVNALTEKQCIELNSNLTIIYGGNGAGKSGYVRLLKNVFYSKDKETILENVNLETGHKPTSAEFNFTSDGIVLPLKFPDDSENGIFHQFAVFDGKIGKKHLSNRNDFSFRPAGLRLFNEFNAALEKINTRLNTEIQTKNIANVFSEDDIFQGESEIKTFLTPLSYNSNLEVLKKHLPYTEKDQTKKADAEKKYDNLKIALSQKDKALKDLQNIKQLLTAKRKNLETINLWFKQIQLERVKASISDCKTKVKTTQKEGVEKFKSDKIKNIGTFKWKQFIEAAETFALTQKKADTTYPEIGDNCLLCHQPIIDDAPKNLIISYWEYIKSVAEQETKTAQENLNKTQKEYEDLNLNQFPESDTLTVWLKENHEATFKSLKHILTNQNTLAESIVANIKSKKTIQQTEIQIDLTLFDSIDSVIDIQIKVFEEDEQNKVLAELLKQKTYLTHKEKLQARLTDIETLHQNMTWVNKANLFNKQGFKSQSTAFEKRLSKQYFNYDYINSFNNECEKLNGKFGIKVDARSSDARSNRQLFLKGKDPSAILSEGEQKVIALADFIAETNITSINKGIIFDDPVNSLDEERKNIIAKRLTSISKNKQVIIFTHDLVFVSSLENHVSDSCIKHDCHWIESTGNEIGVIWLRNTPSYEKSYKKTGKSQSYYEKASKAQPEEREIYIKIGFAALRTNYEALVIFDLFEGVVQRFNERVSVESLSGVYFNEQIRDEILDSFYQCCRYMEGHLHSDKYAYKKPTKENLKDEINRFNEVKKKIKELKKSP